MLNFDFDISRFNSSNQQNESKEKEEIENIFDSLGPSPSSIQTYSPTLMNNKQESQIFESQIESSMEEDNVILQNILLQNIVSNNHKINEENEMEDSTSPSSQNNFNLKINNVVASFNLKCSLNLVTIQKKARNCEYNPK
jgi:hypothetical protein